MHTPPINKRGTVLFAVLFLIVIAALSASTLLTATAAERSAAARSVDELELRAAVRSAIAVATADLAGQRDAMLRGERPETPGAVRIDRGEGEPGIIVEFIESKGGLSLVPESGRLDLNVASFESLSGLPGLGDSGARSIVSRRETVPFRSPSEAYAIAAASGGHSESADPSDGPGGDDAFPPDDGLDPGTETDPWDTQASASDSDLADSDLDAGSPTDGPLFAEDPFAQEPPPDAWLDLVTVYAADPQTMTGLGGEESAGLPRIDINAPWSDRLEQSMIEATGDVSSETLRSLFIDATRMTKPSDLVRLFLDKGVPLDQWAVLLDAITTTADPFRLGLVDINTAGVDVLAALPGISAEGARGIDDARERMDIADRLSVTWPLDEAILSESEFLACVDSITTRCFQWRFMVRASFEPEGDGFTGFDPGDDVPDLLPDADEFGVAIEDEETDAGPALIFEAVLDLAGSRARLAYLRERTAYDFALAVASLPGFSDSDSDDETVDEDEIFYDDQLAPDDEIMIDDDTEADGFGTPGLGSFDLSDDPTVDTEPAGALPSTRDGSDAGQVGTGGSSDNRLGRWAPRRARGNGS